MHKPRDVWTDHLIFFPDFENERLFLELRFEIWNPSWFSKNWFMGDSFELLKFRYIYFWHLIGVRSMYLRSHSFNSNRPCKDEAYEVKEIEKNSPTKRIVPADPGTSFIVITSILLHRSLPTARLIYFEGFNITGIRPSGLVVARRRF